MSYARPYSLQHKRQGAWTTVSRHEGADEATYIADRDKTERASEGRYVPPMRVVYEDRDDLAGILTRTVIWGEGHGQQWQENLQGDTRGWGQWAKYYLDPKHIGRLYLRFIDLLVTVIIRGIIIGIVFLALVYLIPWAVDYFTTSDGGGGKSGKTDGEAVEAQ